MLNIDIEEMHDITMQIYIAHKAGRVDCVYYPESKEYNKALAEFLTSQGYSIYWYEPTACYAIEWGNV